MVEGRFVAIEPLSVDNIGKEQIDGVSRLIDAPVVGHAFQFAAKQGIHPSGVAFQKGAPVQLHEAISHFLGQVWMVQLSESIIDLGEGALLAAELFRDEVMTIEIDLTGKGAQICTRTWMRPR